MNFLIIFVLVRLENPDSIMSHSDRILGIHESF